MDEEGRARADMLVFVVGNTLFRLATALTFMFGLAGCSISSKNHTQQNAACPNPFALGNSQVNLTDAGPDMKTQLVQTAPTAAQTACQSGCVAVVPSYSPYRQIAVYVPGGQRAAVSVLPQVLPDPQTIIEKEPKREARKEKHTPIALAVVRDTNPPAPHGETNPPAPRGDTNPPAWRGDTNSPAPRGDTNLPAPRRDTNLPAPRGDTNLPAPRGDTNLPARAANYRPRSRRNRTVKRQ